MDIRDIYTQIITEESRNPKNKRYLNHPTHEEKGHNPRLPWPLRPVCFRHRDYQFLKGAFGASTRASVGLWEVRGWQGRAWLKKAHDGRGQLCECVCGPRSLFPGLHKPFA